MKKTLRVIIAIIGGAFLGNLIAMFAAMGIDASYGKVVTGEPWKLNLPNFIYAIIIGLLVGFFAGLIAKRKGWLVGAAAQLLSLPFVFVLILVYNRVPANVEHLYHWSLWVGLIAAMIGGQLAEELLNNEESVIVLKRIRWHWLWLWLPLLGFLTWISGSIHFLIADLLIEWQILFHPAFWIFGLLALPLIGTFLCLTWSLPMMSVAWISLLLGDEESVRQLGTRKRVGFVLLIVICIPLALSLIWLIDGYILSFFASNGFIIY